MPVEVKSVTLSNNDFAKLSSFIYNHSGIKMPGSKKIMVEARLRKRLKVLNIPSYAEYCEFLFSSDGLENEMTHMVDVITTNKTEFFREPKQFTFLSEIALPELIKLNGAGVKRPLKVWSAGCSTGEEPYTLSIVINEFGIAYNRFSYNILATDISTSVLEKSILGVFEESRIDSISAALKNKYFLRSKDRNKKLVRVVSSLRNSVNFKWLNFMDNDFGINERFDLIFCRNVIIYFDKPTQELLIEKLLGYLNAGGYLFLGHSESIFNVNLPLVQMSASTYRKIK